MFPILGIFFLGVSFSFSNFCYGQTTQSSSLQQKAIAPQPIEKQSVQPEKTYNPNNSNKLITIEGNPHPQQETNFSKNSGKQIKPSVDEPNNNNSLFIHKPENDGSDNYQIAKAEWGQNYPDEYDAWVKENSEVIHKIPAKEFNTLPIERQENILNNPDKYIIVYEK